jgi:hypothetical protein
VIVYAAMVTPGSLTPSIHDEPSYDGTVVHTSSVPFRQRSSHAYRLLHMLQTVSSIQPRHR